VTARRSLTPAARGVSLAVLAALRAGRVDLADQADGSTLATSTAPDGTELLRATLRMPVRGADPRQLTLGAVSLTPQPAEVPPAPVAVPAGEEPEAEVPAPPTQPEPVRINGLAPGDLIMLDDGRARVAHVDHEGFMWAGADRNGFSVGPVERALWSEVEHVEGNRWRARPTNEQLTEAPAPTPPRVEHNGIAAGDVVTLDDEDFRVTTADEFGWQGVTVATTPRGRPLANVHCDWDDVERVGDRAWRTLPKREKLRTDLTEGAPASKGAKKAPKRAPKAAKVVAAPKPPVVPELPQGDEAPEVRLWIREAEWDALDDATRTEFEEPIGGSGVDWQGREGFVTALVPADEILTALRGMASAVGIRLHEGDAPPAAKRAKAPPARNVPVPEADDLAVYGERSIVAIIHEGGPWELVWSDEMPGHMTYETAVSATTAQAHRVRVYHRGKRCTRDSRDGAK
jgi:hypothetical protein